MKIEKVNDHQIRCTLTREDLAMREIKISELAYGTDKTKSLFREMMQQASFECGFEAEDIPLMIEMIPLNSECIVLIITKVDDPEELDTRFSKFAPSIHEGEESEEDADLMDDIVDGADDVLNMLRKLSSSGQDATAPAQEVETPSEIAEAAETPFHAEMIFSFRSLKDVIRLSHVLGICSAKSSLYKDNGTGNYLLYLDSNGVDVGDFNRLCNIVSEYGTRIRAVSVKKTYFEEHYDTIIRDEALTALGKI